MKRLSLLFILFSTVLTVFAQQEERLGPMGYNPALAKNRQNGHQHKYLIDNGMIVFSDTLSLPFLDDFSRDKTRSYNWTWTHITATYTNVFGTCLGPENVATVPIQTNTTTAYSYSYDTLTNQVDSAPIAPISFTFFGPATAGCFSQNPSIINYWPAYYRYVWDTATDRLVDSIWVSNQTLDYVPVLRFAAGEPGTLWFDNMAYVNNTYPDLPPTIGVATLDGLNEYGRPYNDTMNTTYGTADRLTSLPVNLSGLSESDSLYISFFYEGGGFGDMPEPDDSLILEFKDNDNQWREMWFANGDTVGGTSGNNKFKQVLVEVPTLLSPLTYFYNAFQFRFRSVGALYGNLDHWHIDYVKFDKNRSATDTAIHDVAFVYDYPTILKNYTLMPADQFTGVADLRDSINLLVHNLNPDANSNPPATNYVIGAAESYPAIVVLAPDVIQTFNAEEYHYIEIEPAATYTPDASIVDSLIILSKANIDPNDALPSNDSLLQTQNFNTIMAYDDGSAERAYGLFGLGTKKFAYEFNLNQPDTLVGFQVMYSSVEQNVDDLVFNFYLWDSLNLNSYVNPDFGIDTLENMKRIYVDSLNGFVTYVLDTPLLIQKKVYFGWAQSDERSMQIGFDLNSTLGRQHMFVFINGKWQASTLSSDGSPMMRLIFDSNYWGHTSTAVEEVQQETVVSVYPNPTNGSLTIAGNENAEYEIAVYNAMGQLVQNSYSQNHQFDITGLQNGIYLLNLRNIATGKISHGKVIKTAY